MKEIRQCASVIQGITDCKPEILLILGSGLGGFADQIQDATIIPYADLPSFAASTAIGHKGELILGQLAGKSVAIMNGRFHLYEGYSAQTVAFPIRVLNILGAETLIITNAAGGIRKDFVPGDLMLITDHINLTGENPLIGQNFSDFGPRFPDMSACYSPRLQEKVQSLASGKNLQKGVYAGLKGPNFETPAEIRMLRTLGADAVGMSTVTEVIAAAHAGMQVVGISCITNMAAGILPQPLTHEEVLETGNLVKEKYSSLIFDMIEAF